MQRVVLALALSVGLAFAVFGSSTPATANKGCADTNKDGVINAIDAALILQADAGLYDPGLILLHMWDANDDLEINAIDAAVILQYDAGLLDVVPVCATPTPTPTSPMI